MCHQISHGIGGVHEQFWCLILVPLTLHGMDSVQDILQSSPLVIILVALLALPAVGILGQRRAIPGVVVCRTNLELHTRIITIRSLSVLVNFQASVPLTRCREV